MLERSYKVLENNDYSNDYRMYVPRKSTGLTQIGLNTFRSQWRHMSIVY